MAKPKRKHTKKPAVKQQEPPKEKREYLQGPVILDPGVPCRHCGHRYGHKITHTYPNGNRRRICGGCGLPFITKRMLETSL